MKVVGTYFTFPGKLDYPFNEEVYYQGYQELSERCKKHDIRLIFVRGEESYLGDLTFSHGTEFVDGQLVDIEHPIKVDLIYNKCRGLAPKSLPTKNIINSPELDEICSNKFVTYETLPDHVIPTFKISAENYAEVLTTLPSDDLLIKPLDGEEGQGIERISKGSFTPNLIQGNQHYVVQPFIDTSHGIPGVCEGPHDLRLILFNGKPTLSFLRQPKAGGYISNVGQGGSLRSVDLAHIPTEAFDVAREVDAALQKFFPRVYTIDLVFGEEKVWVVELNSRPGLPHRKLTGDEFAETFYASLIECFKEGMQ
jgi:predicted ATP-grasp superfamily ATP-dependent carboligase